MKFKKGDRVRCIDFDGATGRALEKMPTVLLVYGGHTNSYGEEFVTVGEDDPDARRESAYVTRFTLAASLTQDGAAEYEEAMAFDKLVNG